MPNKYTEDITKTKAVVDAMIKRELAEKRQPHFIESKALQAFQGYLNQALTYLNHGPKHERYGLRAKILDISYELQTLLIECEKRYYKKTTITALDIAHEQLRELWHTYYMRGYFAYSHEKKGNTPSSTVQVKRYLAISAYINTLGELIGALIKQCKIN